MSKTIPLDSTGDYLHRATRAALAAIPFAGVVAVVLFNLILAPPLQGRRDAWLSGLALRLVKLEQDGRVEVDFYTGAFIHATIDYRNGQRCSRPLGY